MKTIGISEARKNIADYFKDAIYKNELIVLSRYDKEKAFLLGEKTIECLIKTDLSPVRFETIQEEDESYTIKLDSLDLVANDITHEKAADDIVYQAKEYANDYLNDLEIYQRDESRKGHFPLLLLIAKASSDEEIKLLLGLNNIAN